MQIIYFLILIFFGISYCSAAASILYYRDSAHPGKCVVRDLVLSPGEIYNNPNECEQITCYEKSRASIYSCGIYKPPEGCVAKAIQPKAPYPDCCKLEATCNNILRDDSEIQAIL